MCKNPPQHFDGTTIVQKALSAIKRTDEQVGFTATTDILKGSRTPLVIAKGVDKLKTFGVGHGISASDWHSYLLQMLQMGYIEIAYNEDNHLKVTPLGEGVLFGRMQAQLSVIIHEDPRVSKRSRYSAPSGGAASSEDIRLFEKLRELRKAIATEIGKPAYVVLSDKSLQSLVSVKPTSMSHLDKCYGFGEYKKLSFGLNL